MFGVKSIAIFVFVFFYSFLLASKSFRMGLAAMAF